MRIDPFFSSPLFGLFHAARAGRSDHGWQLQQQAEEWQLQIDLPGAAPDQVTIDIEGNILAIRAAAPATPQGELLLNERATAPLNFRFRLAETIDSAAIRAIFSHGRLTLHLPMRRPQSRRIEIASAA